MSNVKPLGNRVLVRRSKPPKAKGGILLPDSAQEKPKEGVVVSVGPGKIDDQGNIKALDVKPGDVVMFGSYAGTEVKNLHNDDEEYLILAEDDILGVLV